MNYFINVEEINELLKQFYTLANVKIAVYDYDGIKVTEYPNVHCEYCRILRKNESINKICENSDRDACMKCQNDKKTRIFKCHAGLTEAVTPIMCDGAVIGYVMIGQLFQVENKEKSWEEIEDYISSFDVDISELKKAYFNNETVSNDLIVAASKIMSACASYLYQSKTIAFKEDNVFKKINNYINNNLASDLSISLLCDKFKLTKTKLYDITNQYYGSGIANHIKELRINLAKELLSDTNEQIRTIALKCGIEDYNYFTKIFKKATGYSPRDYRKAITN